MARLFFALWPDERVRNEITDLAHSLPLQPTARLLVPENLHLTLAFLGNVDDPTRLELERGAASIEAAAFSLCLDSLDRWNKPKIACLLPSMFPDQLAGLADGLTGLSRACGVSMEERAYRPHMTLARKVTQALPEMKPGPIHWDVRAFSLMESRSTKQGVKYESRASWPLKIM